jgi:hypothetical protein
MNRMFLGAFVLLLAALCALGTLTYHQAGKLRVTEDALKRATSAAKQSDRATARAAAEKAAVARQMASLRQALDAALASQPEWAAQPVPQEVLDALQ